MRCVAWGRVYGGRGGTSRNRWLSLIYALGSSGRKRLRRRGAELRDLDTGQQPTARLDEDVALNPVLLFGSRLPMRSIERIRMIAAGIDSMAREEAGFWLGTAMHRSRPRRVADGATRVADNTSMFSGAELTMRIHMLYFC